MGIILYIILLYIIIPNLQPIHMHVMEIPDSIIIMCTWKKVANGLHKRF